MNLYMIIDQEKKILSYIIIFEFWSWRIKMNQPTQPNDIRIIVGINVDAAVTKRMWDSDTRVESQNSPV